jgi:hypothetical protein
MHLNALPGMDGEVIGVDLQQPGFLAAGLFSAKSRHRALSKWDFLHSDFFLYY